ncbi:hypothetical protein C9374_000648 [Naegleria lovaniensis]|uniref:F-box domain-containing protein n=1 Tax=Naegleria lovaniensis TaxID=51637 RepID=A0AA88GYT0_NAELO|nr:uncharacterized protein C9374_000648 [Naegleria lovaniensis]KAG2388484.1 hypothetical protein C9374_000648 [Naegleria lovaniensis]
MSTLQVANDWNSSCSAPGWGDIPTEIYGEILSFLPVLPYCFKFSSVCKSWSEQVDYLLNSMSRNAEQFNFHLHFGYVNASKIEYVDLLRIIARCRGVKKITLVNMVVSNEVLNAIALTRVETLIISDCALRSSYTEKRYGNDVVLPFGNKDIDDLSTIFPSYWGRRSFANARQRKEDLQNFKQILGNQNNDPETKIVTRFQFLKYILFINISGTITLNETYSAKYRKLDVFDPGETDLTTLNFAADKEILDNLDDYNYIKRCFTTLLTVNNHSPIYITALYLEDEHSSSRYSHYLTLQPDPARLYSQWYTLRKSIPIFSLYSFSEWVAILEKYNLFHCFDPSNLNSMSDQRLKECMEAKLIPPFALCDGKTFLEIRYLKPMLDAIPMLSSASKKGKKYADWRNTDLVASCIKFITWIHENRPDTVDEEDAAVKKALKACKDVDKKWKTWFESVTFDTKPEDMICWAHFLLTGKYSANSKKTMKKAQTELDMESDEEEEKPKKRTYNRKKKKQIDSDEEKPKKKAASKRKKKQADDESTEKESKKKKSTAPPPTTERRVTRSSSKSVQ